MPNYRRFYVPGGIVFLTLVTYQRIPLFSHPENISRLRVAIAKIRDEKPFEITAAVILPDHLHFLWTLPPGDSNYSQRVSRLKVLLTQSLQEASLLSEDLSDSRQKHREKNVWQHRFWEHTIRDETDLEMHLDYIHYNPVKHGLVFCPHLWKYSSFHRWVEKEQYSADWGCVCYGRQKQIPNFSKIADKVGE